jgi:GT2 family glycosyltransferase
VDNNSGDGSDSRIREAISRFGNVELLESSQNRGYFGGAKWALDQYLARHRPPDWIVVCNNDIVFDDAAFLNRLLANDPIAGGVLAPAVVSRLTGLDANPMMLKRPGRLRMFRYRLLLSTYYVAWLAQWLAPSVRKMRNRLQGRPSTRRIGTTQIYAPHGSIFIFSRKFFEAGGFIDDGPFLYAEEIRVAEMCLRLGLPVIHDPELRVWHEENQTTGRMLSRSIYLHQKNGFRDAEARYKNSYPIPGPARSVVPAVGPEEANVSPHISSAGDTLR